MNTITAEDVKNVIYDAFESDLPETILTTLKPFEGKNINLRMVKALQYILPAFQIRLSRNYGWTELIWESNERNATTNEPAIMGSCMLARTESSVPLDLAWVEKENPAIFAGRRERNEERVRLLCDPDWQERLATALTILNTALDSTVAILNEGNAVKYDIQRKLMDKDLRKISLSRQ